MGQVRKWSSTLREDAGTAMGAAFDRADEKFLALAVTGQPDAISSGNRDLLDLVSH